MRLCATRTTPLPPALRLPRARTQVARTFLISLPRASLNTTQPSPKRNKMDKQVSDVEAIRADALPLTGSLSDWDSIIDRVRHC